MSSNSEVNDLSKTVLETVKERKPHTVKQLAAFVKEKKSVPEREISEAILALQAQGRIRLEDQSLNSSPKLKTYLKTEQALWFWADTATALIAAAVVFAIPENLYPLSLIRIVLGAVFVLCLPGYSLVRALFPLQVPTRTDSRNLDAIERIALSLGMSLALVPMVGLVLNFTPWGIRVVPIVLSLFALTLVFATVALAREIGVAGKQEK